MRTGDFAALEAAFVEHVRALRAADPIEPVVVLVPSHLLRLHLARRLADLGVPHLNVHFVTFKAVVTGCAELVLARQERRLLSAEAAEVLLQQAASRTLGAGYFSKLAEDAGLAAALLATITDLKEGLVEPDELRRAV